MVGKLFPCQLLRWLSWPEKSKCPLFAEVEGLTAMSTSYDYMHCKHIGTDTVQFGSILHLLVFTMVSHQEPLINLQICWKFIVEEYKRLNIEDRYRTFRKLSMFERKKGGPKLKGRACQVVSLGRPLLALWCKYMNEHLEIHKKVRTLLRLNCAMEEMMKQFQHELAFPEAEANTFKDYAFGMAQLHRELYLHFSQEEGQQLFADIPKAHMLLHACLQSKFINPRLTWCYKGEDAMKIARTLAGSCAKGVSGPQVSVKMVSKLRLAWHLRLKALESSDS